MKKLVLALRTPTLIIVLIGLSYVFLAVILSSLKIGIEFLSNGIDFATFAGGATIYALMLWGIYKINKKIIQKLKQQKEVNE